MLRGTSFDKLKIGQNFVHGVWHDTTAHAMYDSSLSLGNQLGMQVVAEGVEDRNDCGMVRRARLVLCPSNFFIKPPRFLYLETVSPIP
ncbi:MAG: EAL domain-containing protein [Herbaspirillum sp.]